MRLILRLILWLGAILLVGVIGGTVWLYQFLTVFGNSIPTSPLTPAVTESIASQKLIVTSEGWEAQKPYLRSIFEKEIYGSYPKTTISWNQERRVVDDSAFGGKATIEEIVLTDTTNTIRIPVVLVTPNTENTSPLIIAATFCASHTAFREYALEKPKIYPTFCDGTSMDSLKYTVLGTYIDRFPAERLIDEGYALASFYTGSIVPDSNEHAEEALKTLSQFSETPVTGIIAAWAWGYSQVMHALEVDPRIDAERVALYGHSRDGKAALLAGAFDESVDAVISHQSGTGGAKPAQRDVGEPVSDMMKNYPFWFDKKFSSYAGREEELSVDQHFLVAMIAPRPLLVTGARQDKWADPKGSFMALRDASAIYNLYTSSENFTATTLTNFVPQDSLAFFMREFNHGVREADWDAFITFLNAHFRK